MTETPLRTGGLPNPADPSPGQKPLETWKEIAAYLQRDARTVRRWEKHEALPVHRHRHAARSSVYAYPSELDRWRATRQPGATPAPTARPLWWRPLPSAAFSLVVVLSLAATGDFGPEALTARAQAPDETRDAPGGPGIVARQLYGGPDDAMSDAMPSPDGRYLFFTDFQGIERGPTGAPSGDLVVQEIATGDVRRLTDEQPLMRYGGFGFFPVPSPDGQTVVMTWYNEAYDWELRVVGVEEGPARTLYRNADVSWVSAHGWTPDGTQILANVQRRDRTHQIVLVSVADGSARTLKSLGWREPSPNLSPDGRYVAYDFSTQEDSTQQDIYVLSTDGRRESQVVEHPANDFAPIWAPDGSGILFVSDRAGTEDLWFLEIEDGRPVRSPRTVKRNVGAILPRGFTSDGSLFYSLRKENHDIYTLTIDPDRGEIIEQPRKLSRTYEGSNNRPDWSPDGQYLAYRSGRAGTPVLIVHSLETGQEREFVFRELGYQFWPRWSPDGKSILIQGNNRRGQRSLHRFDPQTGALDFVASIYTEQVVWGPEGRTIFYERIQGTFDQIDLVVRDLETGEERILHSQTGRIRQLAISPDGARLAFKGTHPADGVSVMLVMSTTGGEPRELSVATDVAAGLAWMKNSKEILFAKENVTSAPAGTRSSELWRIAADGGQPQRLGLISQEGVPGRALVRDLSIDPDGRRVAFTFDKGYVNELWVLERLHAHIEGGQ